MGFCHFNEAFQLSGRVAGELRALEDWQINKRFKHMLFMFTGYMRVMCVFLNILVIYADFQLIPLMATLTGAHHSSLCCLE